VLLPEHSPRDGHLAEDDHEAVDGESDAQDAIGNAHRPASVERERDLVLTEKEPGERESDADLEEDAVAGETMEAPSHVSSCTRYELGRRGAVIGGRVQPQEEGTGHRVGKKVGKGALKLGGKALSGVGSLTRKAGKKLEGEEEGKK